jgi:outer membrane protein TolC
MLPAHLIASRPDIIAARARAEAAAHEINVAKTLFFPDINLNGLFSYQSVGLGHLFGPTSQTNGVTAAFDLPIFDAGARRANLGVKYAEYDIAVQSYNQTILTALRDVADQLSTIRTLKSQLKAQALALRSTRNNYKLFKSRYNHGIVTYTQVLEIRQLLLQQESTQRDLQARHLLAVVAMLKALGGNEL